MYNIAKSYKDLTSEYVKSIISYDPETGNFTWKYREDATKSWNTQFAWTRCGSPSNGYILIRINGKGYRAHRLVWLITHGYWPEMEIDHVNGDKKDNRLTNLRLADRVQQGHNRKSSGKSGLLGVHWCKNAKKWISFTRLNSKKKYLGSFDCPAAASFAYQIATHKKVGDYTREAWGAV